MDWKTPEYKDDDLIKIPDRWLHIHYYEALNILFRFENSLRVFVYTVLKNNFFDDWAKCNFSLDGESQHSIKSIASKRLKQAENFGYLGYNITSPLMHLTSGELVEIITCDAYWPKFKEYFKGNKEIIKNKLLEIGTIRNSLAHFRPIKSDDIELIKQNTKHTLLGVEECLSNVFSQHRRVPTNTTDSWYLELSTIGTDNITCVPHYSEDEKWINVKLTYKTPILMKSSRDTFSSYSLGKIMTANILKEYPTLTKHIIHLNEYLTYPSMGDDWNIIVSKDLNFVFNKDVLISKYKEISDTLKEVSHIITEESELLKTDNLARGKIVKPEHVSVFWREEDKKYDYYHTNLKEPYDSNHPNEYWGEMVYTSDIVGGSKQYPWMPDTISKEDFPW